MMTTHEIKADLYKLIDKINDETLLNAVRTILSKQSKNKTDWANELTEELRTALEASLSDSEKGKIIGHEDAMKQIKIRYNL